MSVAGIVIIGRAYCGKTTLADALVKLRVVDARASFAGELKADLADLGCHKGDPGYREVAIAYGTTHKRAMDPDYWVKRLGELLRGDWHGLVIDDCRFPNEFACLKEKGYAVVRVMASTDVRVSRGCSPEFAVSNHESESALDDVEADITIDTGATTVEFSCLAVMAALGVPA